MFMSMVVGAKFIITRSISHQTLAVLSSGNRRRRFTFSRHILVSIAVHCIMTKYFFGL